MGEWAGLGGFTHRARQTCGNWRPRRWWAEHDGQFPADHAALANKLPDRAPYTPLRLSS